MGCSALADSPISGSADRLVVTSKDVKSTSGTATSLSAEEIARAGTAIPKVTIAESNDADPRGTLVVGELKKAPNIEELKTYLRDFVRYVPIDVLFNGECISRGRFEALDEQQNLVKIGETIRRWQGGDAVVLGRLWEDRGHTLVASVEELVWRGTETWMKGRLRFEEGPIDVFKRGFKLCATQVPTTIGVSGRLDCDLFVPTAGRDSLDSRTMTLLGQLVALLEEVVVDVVLESAGTNRPTHQDFSVFQQARVDRKDDQRCGSAGRRNSDEAGDYQASSEYWWRLGVFRDGARTGAEPSHAGAGARRGAIVVGPVSAAGRAELSRACTVGGRRSMESWTALRSTTI